VEDYPNPTPHRVTFIPDNDLQRALERLTIQEVWRRAGLANPPRDGNLVVKSPFRDDTHGKSFSIFKRGAVAKDQATGDVYSIYRFAELATGITGTELVDRLCEWAGVNRTVHLRQQLRIAVAGAVDGKPIELPPAVMKLARRIEKQAANREAEARVYDQVARAVLPKAEVREMHPWSDAVRGRYLEGWKMLRDTEEKQRDWAKDRGWLVEWVKWLIRQGLIAMPWVPWTLPEAKHAQRGKAFAVDVPVLSEKGELLELRRVGYHQRYFILGELGPGGQREPNQKLWTYVPYMPEEAKQKTEFQREMVAAELARGAEIGRGCIAGVPFVFGDFAAPRLLVVTEGQWDAVTFAGAAGWFEMDPAEWGAAVMGVRGNEGADTLIAYWGKWILEHKPAVLVLADNDAAGLRWTNAEPREPGQPVPPTLAEKLKAAGARRVYVSRVRPELGKDFNDYWKTRRPSPAAIAGWLVKLGFLDTAGNWT
jgi:hypothetical protein